MNPQTSSSSPLLRPGDRVDKFEIVELIGEGGMARVWKAHDRLLSRHVAIKQLVLPPGEDAETLREAFRQEASLHKKVAAAGHEHLVRIYDLIDEPRGLFIVMEYVQGSSLEQLLASQKGAMDVRQALGIVAAAAVGLEALHKQQLIHRDLKPANILLPASGGLKICDFGLAALLADQDALAVGTVRYMAPELFGGEAIDGKADIYSLGIIAYEMLLGRERFEEAFKLILRDTRNQALRWMKWHTNLRVKATPLHEIDPAIPRTLSDLVARMMEKDAVQRIASAGELLSAIRLHFASGGRHGRTQETPASAGAAAGDPTARIPRKNRLPAILAGTLVLWVAVGLAFWGVQESKKQQAAKKVLDEVRARFEQANADRKAGRFEQAKPVFESIIQDPRWGKDKIGKVSQAGLLWCDAMLAMQARQYRSAITLIDQLRELPEMAKEQGELRRVRDEASRRQSFLDVMAQIDAKVAAGSEQSMRDARSLIAKTLATLPDMLAEERQKLADVRDRIDVTQREGFVTAALTSARELIRQGERAKAVAVLDRAIAEHSVASLRDLKAEILRNGQYQDAVDKAKRAEDAGKLAEAASLYAVADQMQGATTYAAKIRVLRSEVAALEGESLENANKLAAAQEKYLEASGLNPDNARARAGMDRIKLSNTFDSRMRAGKAAFAGGEFEAAIRHYEEALKIQPAAEATQKIAEAKVRLTVREGRSLLNRGKRDEAAKLLRTVETDSEAQGLLAQIGVSVAFEELRARGDELYKEGKYAEAKREYRKAGEVKGISDPQKQEIKERNNDAEYAHLMALVRRYLDVKDHKQARGMLNVAKGLRGETPEVTALESQVTELEKIAAERGDA